MRVLLFASAVALAPQHQPSAVALAPQHQRALQRRAFLSGAAAATTLTTTATARAAPPMPPNVKCNSFGCVATALEPPPVTQSSTARARRERLKALGVEFYGAYWCRFCDEQRQLLGREAAQLVNYVECDADGLNGTPALCAAAKIRAYPTWATPDGKLYTGVRSLEQLEVIAGLRKEAAKPAPKPGSVAPPPVDGASSKEAVAVASRLKAAGAVFYGTYWCPYCDKQRQLFGKAAWSAVPSVECDPRGKGGDPGRCAKADVAAYPTAVKVPDGAAAPKGAKAKEECDDCAVPAA
ncbi:Vitamin k epoxide reductase [Aureococcus anophagefferens]|nr:Vitamin k epoxide reductase [Aureococcus anophagefferens]